jgi:hypothetical protein
MVQANPLETTQKFGVVGASVGVRDGKAAEEMVFDLTVPSTICLSVPDAAPTKLPTCPALKRKFLRDLSDLYLAEK